jgi:hypothetical protein
MRSRPLKGKSMNHSDQQVGVVRPLPAINSTDRVSKVNRLRGIRSSSSRIIRWMPGARRQAIIRSLRWAVEQLDESPAPGQQPSAPAVLSPSRSNWEAMWRCVETAESWQDAMDRGDDGQGARNVG